MSDSMWEPLEHLSNAQDLITNYYHPMANGAPKDIQEKGKNDKKEHPLSPHYHYDYFHTIPHYPSTLSLHIPDSRKASHSIPQYTNASPISTTPHAITNVPPHNHHTLSTRFSNTH